MNSSQVWLEATKLLIPLGALLFTYFRFFREGAHKERIEFDIDCIDLGVMELERIIEIGCTAENKGNIEHRFDQILVKVRGIDENDPLQEICCHEPRLSYPDVLARASLISEKWKYYFVRPKVKQRFPLVIRVPARYANLHVRCTFRYNKGKGKKRIHSTERSFHLRKISVEQALENARSDEYRATQTQIENATLQG